jgi:hypothetical protein
MAKKRKRKNAVKRASKRKNWKAGSWIKAKAVRVRKVNGRLVMDVKR